MSRKFTKEQKAEIKDYVDTKMQEIFGDHYNKNDYNDDTHFDVDTKMREIFGDHYINNDDTHDDVSGDPTKELEDFMKELENKEQKPVVKGQKKFEKDDSWMTNEQKKDIPQNQVVPKNKIRGDKSWITPKGGKGGRSSKRRKRTQKRRKSKK